MDAAEKGSSRRARTFLFLPLRYGVLSISDVILSIPFPGRLFSALIYIWNGLLGHPCEQVGCTTVLALKPIVDISCVLEAGYEV